MNPELVERIESLKQGIKEIADVLKRIGRLLFRAINDCLMPVFIDYWRAGRPYGVSTSGIIRWIELKGGSHDIIKRRGRAWVEE